MVFSSRSTLDEHLDTYLALPQQLNQMNADAIAIPLQQLWRLRVR
ncbi:hypothetical protein QUB80_29390 [Chlorogloeopsis sp. ULAP01]|nr:hypothetical protein [Chlorogloeopsis sp. ULAP01]MDM9384774.1 hypothetical protein [Chlorogloeopsis sp. ULAP01]